MQHLDTERLAALADEPPLAAEAAHLAHCLACRRERDAFVALLDLARREGSAGIEPGVLAPVGDPLTSWDALAPTLRAEGLVAGTADEAPTPALTARRAPRAWRPAWTARAAASLALLVGGAAIGRLSAGARVVPLGPAATTNVATTDASPNDAATNGAAPDRQTDATASTNAAAPASVDASAPVSPVSRDAASDLRSLGTGASFGSVTDAARALARAERVYQRAAAYLAEHDSSAHDSDLLRARLAALDEVMPKVREAVSDAPQDPVLNQVYRATYDVRESTIRQLGRTLPVGLRVNGY